MAKAYDAYADEYSRRFADPDAIAARQVGFVTGWGSKLGRGARVLEVGCADGYVTAALARAGLAVTAIDLSPRMIEKTRERLAAEGLHAELNIGDVENMPLEGPFDAVLACMRTFFRYVGEPVGMLRRLSDLTSRKVIVDANPRETNLGDALDLVKQAGIENVKWRPLFVPQNYKLPRASLAVLRFAEISPLVREVILRQKFNVVIKGEKR